MEYKCDLYDDMLVISLKADLDHHLANQLRDEIDKYITEGKTHKLLFDFEQVGFMDSSGIGLIMGRYRKMEGKGTIAVSGVHFGVKRILEISGLHKLVRQFCTLGEATEYLQEVK